MAVLSVPSNTPTVEGATAVCVSDDATGTVYLSVRLDRQWYSVANGDSQISADADKETIIDGTVDDPALGPIVFAANTPDAGLAPSELISGLAPRLDPANPYYIGWVQKVDVTGPVITAISSGTPGETTATITWTTDEPATSSVEYGETAGLGTTEPATPDATLRTSHSVALSGLTSDTLHYYDVTSADAAANSTTEAGTPFTTDSAVVTLVPNNPQAWTKVETAGATVTNISTDAVRVDSFVSGDRGYIYHLSDTLATGRYDLVFDIANITDPFASAKMATVGAGSTAVYTIVTWPLLVDDTDKTLTLEVDVTGAGQLMLRVGSGCANNSEVDHDIRNITLVAV